MNRDAEAREIASWPDTPMEPGGHLFREVAAAFERRAAGMSPLPPGAPVPGCACARCIGTPLTRLVAEQEAEAAKEWKKALPWNRDKGAPR